MGLFNSEPSFIPPEIDDRVYNALHDRLDELKALRGVHEDMLANIEDEINELEMKVGA